MSLSWEEKIVLRGGETSMFTDIDVFGEKYRCFIDVLNKKKTRKNAIVEYLDYQIPVTQLNRQKEN